MTATTAKLTVEGKTILVSDEHLVQFNSFLKTVPASDSYYKNEATFDPQKVKHLQLQPTLTIQAIVS